MARFVMTASVLVAAVAAAAFLFSSSGHADEPSSKIAPKTASVDLQNETCPVTGKPVTEGVTVDVDGTVVHFCSQHCAETYKANPKAYVASLRKDMKVARLLDTLSAAPGAGSEATPAAAQLHDAMRKLWEDHVWWTRLFVVSAIADLPDKDVTTKRLLKNQDDLGNAIKPYYGEPAGTKLTALLKDHILIAADVVTASKAKDSAKAEEATKRWFANADEIAAFLSGANPSAWPQAETKKMMHEHLQLTTEEVKARLNGQWDADIAAWEKVRDQALHMADMLTDGIRKQFPDKVR